MLNGLAKKKPGNALSAIVANCGNSVGTPFGNENRDYANHRYQLGIHDIRCGLMNQTQIEEIISKLVPLTLELSAQLILHLNQKKDGPHSSPQRITAVSAENLRSMCDELLYAFTGRHDADHRLVR